MYNLLIILGLLIIAVMGRVLPHPPNFTPITAVALFSAAIIPNRILSFGLPIFIMGVSDMILGFHNLIPTIYGLILLQTLIGTNLRNNITPTNVVGTSLLSSILFFIGSNFMVWYGSTFYTQDLSGLIYCYVMALPFFHYTILGDLYYSTVLFGSWYLVTSRTQTKTI